MAKKGKVMGSDSLGYTHRGKAFTAKGLVDFRRAKQREYAKIRAAKKAAMLARFAARLEVVPMEDWDDEASWNTWNDPVGQALDGYLKGKRELDISNAGGEFEELVKSQLSQKKKKYKDTRSRRDIIERRVHAFRDQLPLMIDAYLDWSLKQGDKGLGNETTPTYDEEPESHMTVKKVDTYISTTCEIPLYPSLPSVAASFVRQGLIPCAPTAPSLAISVRVLELFRASSMRCPNLSIQAFVKALCDIQCQPYRSYISRQFGICYDTYLDILNGVENKVQEALGRNDPMWRLKHACVPCTYKLQNEEKLKFSMLVTMDGNDSLKRLIKRETDGLEGEGMGESMERNDPRTVHGDYYLSREEVDKWARESVDLLAVDKNKISESSPGLCDDRWKNMASDKTSRMWGIFDETGIFLSLCRHGHVLVVMDMVRSGEQSKYPLATVNSLLDAFGENIGIGYDIGCKFKKTLQQSKLGPRAASLKTTCLVGSFHGHAHNRICQLEHLATYVEGLGNEDLEGCEPFFSRSNALASSTRHASIFHRRQKINKYIKHLDTRETYLSLSSTLVTSYKRALEILAGEASLSQQAHDKGLGAPDTVFPKWLEEEYHYLTGLKREPLQETLQMEYYQKLKRFYKSEANLAEIMKQCWKNLDPSSITTDIDDTLSNERRRRHAQENHARDLEAVQILEHQLGIEKRWQPGNKVWVEAEDMVNKRHYQRSLDHLEGLVVARLFELTKMNMSQTGYKMRQHIGKALKTRSQAIQTALKEFNTAAESLGRETLTWDDVVNCSQLADFDLLSDTREDVRKRPWATPASRLQLDQYFKIKRAHEEIKRLNIEIRRLTTYIRDEEYYLSTKAASLRASQPSLAHQIDIKLITLRRMNDIHLSRLSKLNDLSGFTGTLDEGISIENGLPTAQSTTPRALLHTDISEETITQAEEEEEQEEDEQEAGEVALKVLQVSLD
ncbi:hypothetical protein CVT24_006543 [Panaeolus cyanescens]|uniref:CxC1-like cysteine cluster associated with KDZ transposases domain-containing protein n=1 Tax=Panaeolus cyanescens TaxID=181874 RepID=A0A409WNL0_9AGAR|nr:hypothetical protein CVT24_006543 [Panaeolus cyanescens]